MVLRIFVRRNFGRKSLVSIKRPFFCITVFLKGDKYYIYMAQHSFQFTLEASATIHKQYFGKQQNSIKLQDKL